MPLLGLFTTFVAKLLVLPDSLSEWCEVVDPLDYVSIIHIVVFLCYVDW
jgi:hypothetical protein